MIRRTKSNRESPEFNTAALPDIIFMLLFFFMVVTVLKTQENNIKYTLPNTSYNSKLEKNQDTNYIYLGHDPSDENQYLLQVNDDLVSFDNLLVSCKSLQNVTKASTKTYIKIDQDMPMSIVNELKEALQQARIYKVTYIVDKEMVEI